MFSLKLPSALALGLAVLGQIGTDPSSFPRPSKVIGLEEMLEKVGVVATDPTRFPRQQKVVGLEEVLEKADVVAIVTAYYDGKTKEGKPFLESNPPLVLVRPISIFKFNGDYREGSFINIVWQTSKKSKPPEEGGEPILLPDGSAYMVYLKRKNLHTFERYSKDWSFFKLAQAPNVMAFNIHPAWRLIAEVSPFLSQVGDQISFRYYGTHLGERPFQGSSPVLPPGGLTLLDVKRRQQVTAKNPGKTLQVDFGLPKGATVIHEIDLTKHFDLNKPGEYWLFEGKVPLRFEVSDKVQVLK